MNLFRAILMLIRTLVRRRSTLIVENLALRLQHHPQHAGEHTAGEHARHVEGDQGLQRLTIR